MLKSVVNCVELMKLDPTKVPLKKTLGKATKLVPLIVTCAPKPVGALVGLMEVMVGTGFGWTMVSTTGDEGPPPGVGLLTVIWGVPTAAISLARIEALSWFLPKTVVVLGEPLKLSVAVEAKFVPKACRVKPRLPATTLLGVILLRVGTGYVPTLTVKLTTLEGPTV